MLIYVSGLDPTVINFGWIAEKVTNILFAKNFFGVNKVPEIVQI